MVRQEFDGELEAIEARVMKLFAMVAEDLRGATQALLSGDNEVLGKLAEREQVIGVLYPEIEQLVNREILLQAPVASDLRFLLSVLRIVPDLERSHHLVLDIAATCSAKTSRRAAEGSWSGWEASHRTCGARQCTPGTSGTVPPRLRFASAMPRWTCFTPA
jgi:phosphate transport system protein